MTQMSKVRESVDFDLSARPSQAARTNSDVFEKHADKHIDELLSRNFIRKKILTFT